MASELYEFGAFRLDPSMRRLTRDGEAVSLTPKTFHTLLVLVAHAGESLTRSDLAAQVWPDTNVGEHNLNQCIAVLRKTLDDNAKQPNYIATLPGRGYSFIAEVRRIGNGSTSTAAVVSEPFPDPPSIAPLRLNFGGRSAAWLAALAGIGLLIGYYLYGHAWPSLAAGGAGKTLAKVNELSASHAGHSPEQSLSLDRISGSRAEQALGRDDSDLKPVQYSRSCMTENEEKICIFTGPLSNGALHIRAGLNNDLWLGSLDSSVGHSIVHLTTKGLATPFPIPGANAGPEGIALGPDDRIWFTEYNTGSVGAITAAGEVSEYPLGFLHSKSISVTVGADENLWFTTDFKGMVKVTPNGKVTIINLPNGHNAGQLTADTLGSDGNVWFMEGAGPCFDGENYTSIGKVTPAGKVTIYNVRHHGNGYGITAGPDGRIWFADPGGCKGYTSRIGAINTDGTHLVYYSKNLPPLVDTIMNGGDGNLYFGTYSSQIGRITPNGVVTFYDLPSSPRFVVLGMTVGPDHNIWFASLFDNRVGVLYLK